MNWLSLMEGQIFTRMAEIVTIITGVPTILSFFRAFGRWIGQSRGTSPASVWRMPIFLFVLTLAFFILSRALPFWENLSVNRPAGTSPTAVGPATASLPARVRLELLGIELQPPVKSGWVRIKAYVGEDTFIFPSTGTSGWLPVSGAWNNQSMVLLTKSLEKVRIEIDFAERQSDNQIEFLSTNQISYKGGVVNEIYSLTAPDSTSPAASGMRSAKLAYRLTPAL